MADHEILALNEAGNRVEAPQTGDRYLLARDVNANGKSIVGAGPIDSTGFTGPHTELTNHLNDGTDAHDAAAISFDNAGTGMAATNTQDAIEELKGTLGTVQSAATVDANNLSAHLVDSVAAHAASAISFDNGPSTLSAITVQAAIDELDAEKYESANVSAFGNSLVGETTNVFARRRLGAAVSRYSRYKTSHTTPILIVSIGQSNPLGIEPAVTQFPVNNNVHDYRSTNRYTAGSPYQGTDPAVGFGFYPGPNPGDSVVTDWNGFAPYVGYLCGGKGNQVYAAADRIQKAEGRDVYVLSICQGAVSLSYMISTIIPQMETFLAYILANTPALADVDFPDIVLWGQSEGNMLTQATGFSANYLAPLAYKDAWVAEYLAGKGVWWDPDITNMYLTEPTQYANWTGTPSGVAGDVSFEYPCRWEGINAVARYTPENVRMVSSVGLPWMTTGSGQYIHYSGDGNNQYGARIADVELGYLEAMGPVSSELERERNPKLGGDMNAQTNDLNNVGNLDAASATIDALTLGGNASGGGFSWTGINDIDAASATIDALIAPEITTGTIKSSVANGGSAIGWILDTINNLTTAGAKLLSLRNFGVEKFSVDKDGNTTASGKLNINGFDSDFGNGNILALLQRGLTITGQFAAASYTSAVANGASAVAYAFNTVNALTTTAKIFSFRNVTTEKAFLQQDGYFKVVGGFGANYRTATEATSWTTADHTIHFISGTGDLQMPDITAAMTGAVLLVINTRGTSVTLTPHASDAFSDGASVPNGATWMYVCNGVSTWQRVNL